MFSSTAPPASGPVLDEAQRRAVSHDGGPLLVVAGAGTGKTATLAARVAHLLEGGAEPSRMCLLTFSRRAAAELLARAGASTTADARRVVGGTFHAVAQQLLRRHGAMVGLGASFTVLDAADAIELMGLVRQESGLASSPGARRFPTAATLVDLLGQVANAQEPLVDVVARSHPASADHLAAIRTLFAAYTARKRSRHLCDFDDLLLLLRALGRDGPGGPVLAGLFDHVLVDEYQDVNALQADIVASLTPGGRGLTVVGDPAQAIYGFRAASPAAMADFARRYPGAEVVALERSYRSTAPVLALANQVLAEGEDPPAVVLRSTRPGRRRPLVRTCADEGAQAEAVCDAVLSHREDGVALRRQAVLFRAGHHAAELELALGRRRIPFVKYGGLRFLDAAHVRDLLALLRILDNPFDELAWFRTLRTVEGVGPATARAVMTSLGLDPPGLPGSGPSPGADPGAPTPLARLLATPPPAAGAAASGLGALRRTLARARDEAASGRVPVDTLRRWLDPVVGRRYDKAPARIGDLARLGELAVASASLAAFVAELTLDPPAGSGDLAGAPTVDDDWLVLSTVHSAKGGEWDVVHLVHASDGMFPSDLATGDAAGVAEERRLFYVAVTRARDVLEVNVPLRYHHHRGRRRRGPAGDLHSCAPRSRFLSDAVVALADDAATPGPAGVAGAGSSVAGPGGVAAVDDALARLWG